VEKLLFCPGLTNIPTRLRLARLSLAEMRRGIELKVPGKARRELERQFHFVLEDYSGGYFQF